ncbi:MAG: tetratricopeptide repeat-containing sensor histidine kinase [Rufibacter sp.]
MPFPHNGGKTRPGLVVLLWLLACSLPSFGVPQHSATSVADSLHQRLELATTDSVKVEVLCDLSRYYWKTDVAKALEFGKQAEQLALAKNLPFGRAKALNNIGASYYMVGDLLNAAHYYYQSLRLREQIGDSLGLCVSFNNIGNVYNTQKNYGKALEAYRKSAEIARAIHDPKGLSRAYNNIGNAYERQGRLKESLEIYQQALELKKKAGDQMGVAISLNNIGFLYGKLGQPAKGIPYNQAALRLDLQNKDDIDRIYSLRGLAQNYYLLGQQAVAAPYGLQSLQLAQQQGSLDEAKITAEILDSIYEASGNMAKAHFYLRLARLYGDSLQRAQEQKQLQDLHVRYETDKKERENAALRAQQLLHTQELERKQWQQYFWIFALGTLVALALALFLVQQQQRRRNQKLEAYNAQILKQKAEIEAQALALKEQKAQLEELNLLKNKLFSIISHDLRAPFGSLQNFLALLEEQALMGADLNVFFPYLRNELSSTLFLLDNLLRWSKSQMEGTQVQPEQVQVFALAQETVDQLSSPAQAKQLQVANVIPPDTTTLADKEMLRFVLRNLLANAIKFTPDEGTITLLASQEGSFLQLSVKDTGVGISPERQATLFSNHLRSTSGTHQEKGTGLGLILCKEFVEKNGGSITVQSTQGVGSIFTVALPMPAIKAKEQQVAQPFIEMVS